MTHPACELIEHYRQMVVIRVFEEALDGLFGSGVVSGTSHFCLGQEACAVGAVAALEPGDLVTSNHRGHGHFIARGGEPARIMAELFGKAEGYSKGRGGSQHMADFSIGFLGSNGITGGMTPIATGAALSQKLLATGRIVLCFFGDGATGQGAFYEALNMGVTWGLPIIYLCENNQYAMSTSAADAFREPSVAARVSGFGIQTARADGNDYFALRQSVQEAALRARSGDGPTLVEAMTYRMCGHSKSDRCEYRSDEEEAAWAARDPIRIMAERLLELGAADEGALAAVKESVARDIELAVEFAREAPLPDPHTTGLGLFSDFD